VSTDLSCLLKRWDIVHDSPLVQRRWHTMQSAAALLPVGTSANGACRLDHACLGRLVGRKSSQAVQSSLDITEGRHPTSCG